MTVEFRQVDRVDADDLFVAPPKEAKWAEVTAVLLTGKAVFIPGMDRNALESLRSIVNYRRYGRLRSRNTEVDGVQGRLLRIQRRGA